jgi:hypothetical protein
MDLFAQNGHLEQMMDASGLGMANYTKLAQGSF